MTETPPERDHPFAGLFDPEHGDATDDPGRSDHQATAPRPDGGGEWRPATRREAREAREAHPSWTQSSYPRRRRARRRWIVPTVVSIVIVGLLAGGGAVVWSAFGPQIGRVLGLDGGNDFEGRGTGEALVTIKPGDIGEDIARTLHDNGVTKTFDAFYSLLLSKRDQPVFQPGTYRLKKGMSASAALDALLDPANRLSNRIVIPEGTRESDILKLVSESTKIPLDQLMAAAGDVSAYGLPPEATTLEGFLFPASYVFDPDSTPQQVLAKMVDRAKQALDDVGVPPEQRWRIVTLASIVQAEAGPNPDDLGKIARVFQNRLEQDIPLESDATIHYGLGEHDSIWITKAQYNDASNPYNTYVHPGLTPAPIGNPGEAALAAALNPTPGSWIFFVTVDLKTGETVFSTTAAEQDAAAERLQEWCRDPANKDFCG